MCRRYAAVRRILAVPVCLFLGKKKNVRRRRRLAAETKKIPGKQKHQKRTPNFKSEINILTGLNVSHLRQNPKWDRKWTVVTVEKGQ